MKQNQKFCIRDQTSKKIAKKQHSKNNKENEKYIIIDFQRFFFHFLSRSKFIKFRQQNDKFKIARKINKIENRNFEFYMNNEVDTHIVYDKSLFNEIKSLKYKKQIEVFIEVYIDVKEIEFIIMNLKINDKKIINTITEMKYVFDTQYNFISTSLLCRKNCKIEQDDEFYILINTKTDDIFMIDIIQKFNQKNFYIVNKWAIFRTKIKKIEKNTWMQWHCRLDHLNMKNVKKFVDMKLIDVNECNKSLDIESIDLCECCIMNKMHRTFNKKSMKIDSSRRITRKKQRIHTDLIEKEKITKTSRDKRYAIIFINDFIDYIWIYLIRKKNEYKQLFKKFIFMLKAKNIDIESIRCDNVDENINDEIDVLLKKHDIKWKFIVLYNSHQNEMIERVFRIIFNKIRVCLYDVKFSKKL